jgi:NAD(P) transhydrogenase subunit alpha
MLAGMKYGSVIIDIAAATGGNTAKTVNNQTVMYNGITIVGDSSLASSVPSDASKLYGKNVLNFLQLILTKAGEINLDFADDIVKGACITYDGRVVNERVANLLNTQ